LVAYPLFAKVGVPDYVAYHKFYLRRIPLPVILPGFLSMFTPVMVLVLLPASVPVWMAWANVVCGAVTLYVAVGLEIPRHGRLKKAARTTGSSPNWSPTIGRARCPLLARRS
jgi:hypothetical protein